MKVNFYFTICLVGFCSVLFSQTETLILPSDGSANEFFGYSVGISGDRMISGAYKDDVNGFTESGSAYIYDWDGASWIETKINASNLSGSDFFGRAVDIDGDRCIVGAHNYNSPVTGLIPGAVYIYDWDGTNWNETFILASDQGPGDDFGFSTGISGDRCVVGAYNDNNANGTDAGSIYIYDWNGTNWIETKIIASDGAPFDRFGESVAIDGDKIFVGAPFADINGNSSSGATYLYEWNGTNWIETKLTASNGDSFDRLGESVDVKGNILVAGAFFDEQSAGVSSGSAYVYIYDGTSWIETNLFATDAQDGDLYGNSVAVGNNSVFIGAAQEDANGAQSGSVYIYDINSNFSETKLTPSDGGSNDRFSIVDVDGNDFVVGAYGNQDNGTESGSMYHFGTCVNSTYYLDMDADTYGDAGNSVVDCNQPSGYVLDNTDCDDTDSAINPGATEICDGIDNNCDGQVDEGLSMVFYLDADTDGYGDKFNSITDCNQPSGFVLDNTDCNDTNPAINPGATEICDGVDNNCNGQIDEGLTMTYYIDADGDGFGDISNSIAVCNPPSGYVLDNTDCNDNNPSINPSAIEICDGVDNNCDGQVDEGLMTNYYLDSDGDGYGDNSNFITDCNQPNGYVIDNTDCNDNNPSINPGAIEICDGVDNNCDGQVDEGLIMNYYLDSDGDGYGNNSNFVTDCNQPNGYVINNTDCDDSNATVYPGATELCDGLDNNCDGLVDNNSTCTCPSGFSTNTFIGNNDEWTIASNWSLGIVPDVCQHVIIPVGKTAKLLSGEIGVCYTVTVQLNAFLDIAQGADFHAVAPN